MFSSSFHTIRKIGHTKIFQRVIKIIPPHCTSFLLFFKRPRMNNVFSLFLVGKEVDDVFKPILYASKIRGYYCYDFDDEEMTTQQTRRRKKKREKYVQQRL